jgi:hypothetical protein
MNDHTAETSTRSRKVAVPPEGRVIGQIIGLSSLEASTAALCDEPLVRFADRASEGSSSRSGQFSDILAAIITFSERAI